MSALPRRDIPDNTLFRFRSPEEFFACLFGPEQQDAHVAERRLHFRNAEHRRQLSFIAPACAAMVAEVAEQEAQRLALTHGYDTKALRREYDRWHTGCFSKDQFAKPRARQLLRALDIAIEHHGAHALAAE